MTRVSITRKLNVRAAGSVPSWVTAAAPNTWFSPPGDTTIASVQTFTSPYSRPKPYVLAYSGAALKLGTSEIFVAGGGHADYAGNEVYSLALSSETPGWVLRRPPTAQADIPWNGEQTALSAHYNDGAPVSRHSYWNLHFHESLNRLFFLGAKAVWSGPANTFLNVDAFNASTNDYDPADTYDASPAQNTASGMVLVGTDVYLQVPNTGTWHRWNGSDQTWTTLATRSVYNPDSPLAYDSTRNRILRAGSHPAVFDLGSSLNETTISFGGTHGAAASAVECSAIYVPEIDRYLLMRFGSPVVYQIDPTTWAVTPYTVQGIAPSIPGDGTGLFYGRFMYVPNIRCVAVVASTTQNVKLFKVA